MAQDSMVAEYRGERLRREVADKRERLYRAQGKDCYLFGVSDDLVIDSTMRGTISRFAVSPPAIHCLCIIIVIHWYSDLLKEDVKSRREYCKDRKKTCDVCVSRCIGGAFESLKALHMTPCLSGFQVPFQWLRSGRY